MRDFLAQRATHIASATPGVAAAQELCSMTDEAVRELSLAASSLHSGRWAIAALGGWGSGALLPKSDLDILVLSDLPPAQLKPFVEAVLYPLWDAGLKVGHQVRSPKQQLKAMREDMKTRTAALTGRGIAGDVEWAAQTLAACANDARKHAKRALADLAQRERPGCPWALSVDLKDGAGGRRDYDELTWTAAIVSGAVRLDPFALVELELLTTDEWARLRSAAAVVTAGRWMLQREGFGDRLTVEAANELEPELGGERIQAALGDTSVLLEKVRTRLPLQGRAVADDTLHPLAPWEVFALLDRGDEGFSEVAAAAQRGALDTLLPGFSALMATRRPGLGHELTVGAHCVKAAVVVGSLDGDPTLSRSLATVGDVRMLQVASLAHDVGKVEGGAGHAERGAGPAADAVRAFGLGEQAALDAADLVRLHLLLAETALRADLDDEDTILRAAARVGRPELLAPLHLLTAADSIATGPSTWTPWTATLVGTLVARIDAALSPDTDGAGLAEQGEKARRVAMQLLPHEARPQERSFIEHAPLRYLASRDPGSVMRDARLVADLATQGGGSAARIAVSTGPVPETHVVTVASKDRPELLSRLAGAMSLAGMDILSVDAYGAPGNVVLDSFVVTSATMRPLSTESFTKLERLVESALRDRLELATRLAERRRHYPAQKQMKPKVTTTLTGWDTAVSVKAANRPGLLHDITRAISAEGVDIRWAKIQTIDGVARDTFHVVGDDGGPVDDPGVLGHLAMRVREAV